jgi:ferredoxin
MAGGIKTFDFQVILLDDPIHPELPFTTRLDIITLPHSSTGWGIILSQSKIFSSGKDVHVAAVIEIDAQRCKGCGYCVAFCKPEALAMADERNAFGRNFVEVNRKALLAGAAAVAKR